MKNLDNIHEKLKSFLKRFYTNEIIKGGIFFVLFGLLYFFLTLFIEYFFWLEPQLRTFLFWSFIFIELLLLFRFVVVPIFKLVGLKSGLTDEQASKIIGDHFKEIDDKLLNIIQLEQSNEKSELLLASIEQKSGELRPFSFNSAISFKDNVVYLKYLMVPVVIWFAIWLTGNNSIFTQSLHRVVHHQTAFEAPAPFRFEVVNDSLETLEDNSFKLQFRIIGDLIPENPRIFIGDNFYYATPEENGLMSFVFENPRQDIEFFIEGNEIFSKPYMLKVRSTPKITDFRMVLNYPGYLNKPPDTISKTGNAETPAGTEVTWLISSQNASRLDFSVERTEGDLQQEAMTPGAMGKYTLTKRILRTTTYEISSSNDFLTGFETLRYQLLIVPDEFPTISVDSDIDSVSRGPVQFKGQLTDDYGISRLQVVARDKATGKQSIGSIDIDHSDFETFFYVFPEGIILEEGVNYDIYFEVFDNDAIKGPKKTVSRAFSYQNKTEEEEAFEILEDQKEGIEELERSKASKERMEKSLEEFSKKLKNKEKTDWNDQKQLDEFIERQKAYQDMMEENSEKMKRLLDEMDTEDEPMLNEDKEELKKRWEELTEFKEKEALIKELEELAEKLQKEDLLEKVDKLKEQSKQETRSLERILELTKQFYVEKKSAQIMKQLDELAEEQLDLSTEPDNSKEEQERLNEKFDSLQKDFKELREQNETLKNPMDLFDSEPDEKLIEMDMEKAAESLEKSEQMDSDQGKKQMNKAKEQQRKAANRMKELSKKMESSLMEMEMQGMEENIEDLQQVLKNLLIFSLDQEDLMLSFESVSAKSADYPEKLKEQIKLKTHFEHIDDSLYNLSLRMVKLSSKIQEDLSSAHYNLDKSLENISENRITQGISNQQYTMTAANNLADLLSDMLESLQNKKPGSGKGKGKEGELSLPDVIKKQQEMMQQMQEGMDAQKGQGKKGKEAMSGEQFQMYQEQKMLKEQMQNLLEKEGAGSQEGKAVLDQMDALEKLLLEKGISNETLKRMQLLEHELLELESAELMRNQDKKRKSETNRYEQQFREIDSLRQFNEKQTEDEVLRRRKLDMTPNYRKKVKKYFEVENN